MSDYLLKLKDKPIISWIFFIVTLTYSWIFWTIAIILGQNYMSFPTVIFYALGGFGPSLVGLILLKLTHNKDEKQEFIARSFDPRRIGPQWYIIIIVIIIGSIILAMLISSLLWSDISFLAELSTFSLQVLDPLYFAFLVIAVLAEEFGWRGFALDPLQKKNSALNASLQIGVIWSIWHFPLYFIQGTFQNGLGFASLSFFLYSLDIIPAAIMYTWLYNSNDRSILIAILFHFFGNFISEMFEFQIRVQIIRLIVSISITAILVIYFGPKRLQRKET